MMIRLSVYLLWLEASLSVVVLLDTALMSAMVVVCSVDVRSSFDVR